MKHRFPAVIIIALAVLFCQSGGVVLASICPHLHGTHATCHGMVAATDSQPANGAALQSSDNGAVCNHCVIPAGNKRDDVALQEANSAQRAGDVSVSIPVATANPPLFVKNVTWVAKAHGPPRDAGALYVLINVFRI